MMLLNCLMSHKVFFEFKYNTTNTKLGGHRFNYIYCHYDLQKENLD
jgi:hypothetical protein